MSAFTYQLSEEMLFIFFFHFQPGKGQASDLVGTSVFHTSTLAPPPTERPASRRDAATLTEAVANGKKAGILGPGHRRRRRWQRHRLNEPYISEEEPSTDGEDELINRMRQDRHSPEPERKERRRAREHRKKRCNFSPNMVLMYFHLSHICYNVIPLHETCLSLWQSSSEHKWNGGPWGSRS